MKFPNMLSSFVNFNMINDIINYNFFWELDGCGYETI